MIKLRNAVLGLSLFFLHSAIAEKVDSTTPINANPISISTITSTTIPTRTSLGGSYLVTYRLTSNLPFQMRTPFNNTVRISAPAGEFTINDGCHGVALAPGGGCNLSIGLNARTTGAKSTHITISYGNNSIPLSILTTTDALSSSSSWVGLIGVDYNPNHYPNGNQFNFHDVFYVGNVSNVPISNVYAELSQLKAAGFSTVRSYQTEPYSWIDIIQQAKALGMKVVYEADIPQNGSQANINTALSVLTSVINVVGATTFQETVSLVFAGHENYSSTDINYLTSAVSQLQSTLSSNGITVPVGSALVSGNLVTPSPAISSDMTTLIHSYSPGAPLAFDPYPFQWGVTPPDQAVSNITLINSIAWDYAQAQSQSFYVAPRTILMAETGWATQGTNAGYFCAQQNICAPGVGNAGTYLTALYSFVRNSGHNSGALVFEAYDEPAKDPGNPNDAENFYGVFDSNCNLKSINLLPNTSFVTATNPGCRGFTQGALLVVVGNTTTQPPFTVQIQQTNPITQNTASMTVTVPTQNRTDNSVLPWPQYLVFNGAIVSMTGSATNNTCTVPITVNNATISFGAVSCTGGNVVNCSNGVCFLPTPF
ncbi:hypothetical protein [Legionella cardiaca]|uniref:Endo-1,3-beta-glucanase btgC n=1 Tax=Legionella cardiaca TaxID=1071983 RepID=A0ABY8ATP1_9GAMM|nr:hypothetical protein [Legionella cardiaca]WED42726.1 hypothetical protein PXX05_12600 [Legionella cardiaca]